MSESAEAKESGNTASAASHFQLDPVHLQLVYENEQELGVPCHIAAQTLLHFGLRFYERTFLFLDL